MKSSVKPQSIVFGALSAKEMIGLDTNIILRYFVEDDLAKLLRQDDLWSSDARSDTPGFIDRVALCELIWVLSSGYRFDRTEICQRHYDAC